MVVQVAPAPASRRCMVRREEEIGGRRSGMGNQLSHEWGWDCGKVPSHSWDTCEEGDLSDLQGPCSSKGQWFFLKPWGSLLITPTIG